MELKDGTLLYEGKYRIVRLLATGNFGYTYEAVCTRNDTRVAVKEFFLKNCCERHSFNDEVSASTLEKVELFEKMKRGFLEEAKSLFLFNHPNIVRLTDVFLQNGTVYYVMDYVEGITLKDLVQQKGRFREGEALSYMDQLCDAIEYVHSKSRMHLDIRPDNIVITSDSRVKLADFGFSKRIDPNDYNPDLLGFNVSSNSYSPIELNVESDATITSVSDIYSLGAVLYKLLTGNTPPDAAMLVDYPLAELPSDISPHVALAIEKAMSPTKANRPQRVADFRRMLHSPVHAAQSAAGANQYTGAFNEFGNPYTAHLDHNSSNAGGAYSDNGGNGGNSGFQIDSNQFLNDSYNNNNGNQHNNHNNSYNSNSGYPNPGHSNNGFPSYSGPYQNESTQMDQEEGTLVTPDRHSGSEMSQIDFHLDSISPDNEGTSLDPTAGSRGNGGNANGGGNGNVGGNGNSNRNHSNERTQLDPSHGSGGGNRGSRFAPFTGAGGSTGGRDERTQYDSAPSKKFNWGLAALAAAVVILIGGGAFLAYDKFSTPSAPVGSTTVTENAPGMSLGSFAVNNSELMGELNGHYWVDLGLPSGTRWATTNVGATTPMEYGGYFAWGETDTKNVYNYENAATYEKPMGHISGKNTFDAATKQWGEAWQIPSKTDFEELLANCSSSPVEIDDVRGILFTSRKNGQSIFLPQAGFHYGVITSDTDASYVGTEGTYWSDTPADNDATQENAYGLRLHGKSIQDVYDKFHRGAGRSIRPVAKQSH